jgi:hypothetical protein
MGLGIALDGLYSPKAVATIIRSLGGAGGGVPSPPVIGPVLPEAQAFEFRPTILARDVALSPTPLLRATGEPSTRVSELRPQIVPTDGEDC